MKKTALKCFVAMAFERDDTDTLFKKTLRPIVKKKLGVDPVRIDQLDFNGDIDDKIIAELKEADIVVADLTYARPSVYFEAGFAQRQCPVIYTCRKDHFTPRQNDTFGNFRVHFDLQMKNIIPWSNPTDGAFYKKLEKRINRVIIPILRAKRDQANRLEEATQFARLSTHKRMMVILRLAVNCFRRYGFSGQHTSDLVGIPLVLMGGHKWEAVRAKEQSMKELMVFVTPTLTKTQLCALRPPFGGNGDFKQVERHVLVCSLKRVPDSRVASELVHFSRSSKGHYVRVDDSGHGKVVRHFHVVDAIDSERMAKESIAAVARQIS